uniref:K Homology domain-containing protein n=1 Tax=Ditylenchus dipsaci TaxID=166011 RepID=A0A915DAU1_9BILA
MDYLADLLKEKQHLSLISNALPHAERLVDEEISRARSVAFKGELSCEDLLKLPDPKGEMVKLTEKVFLPIREHPGYNFVGRILGPRGMTAKQLEQETGCKIMIRGKGLCVTKSRRSSICEDTKERATIKLEQAVSQIKKLLILPTAQGIDELKRKQLMELSIINGTYRPPRLSIRCLLLHVSIR